MRSRGVGGILAVLWFVISITGFAQGGLLYLNEEPLSLIHPIIQQGTSLLVPLEEFCPLVGLELTQAEGSTILRGSGFRRAFDPDMFLYEDRIAYASLDWLLGSVKGTMHQVGGDAYLRTERPQIIAVEASASQVTVRLTGFTSHEVALSQQGLSDVLTITWPHGKLGLDAGLIRIGESDIQAVRFVSSANGVDLAMTIEAGTNLAAEELETEAFYSMTFSVADSASVESVIEIGEGIAVHEWEGAEKNCTIDYVYVEAWRDQFRLLPAVPTEGYQSTASLQTMLEESSSVVAVSLDCPLEPSVTECLVMRGIPYHVPDVPSEVLAIDLFGRWSTFSSLCAVTIKHAGTLIDVDGVNRPLAYGEIVIYTSGYSGSMARGIPGSFSVIKIRENRVVSIYDGPFVPTDTSAILLAASGDARARLTDIQLGDSIGVLCDFLHADGTYPYAVTAGPQLMGDGILFDSGTPQVVDSIESGTVLACDWQGGLYLLVFGGVGSSAGEEVGSLADILHGLPTVIKDAVLLSSCRRSAIAYVRGNDTFQLGIQDPIRLALCLIPLAP